MINASAPFTVEPAARTLFGPGTVQQLPAVVAQLGGNHVFIVTDPGVAAAGIADRVARILSAAGIHHTVHAKIGPNPSTASLDTGASAAADAHADVVLALGGGSSLDAAKGIALLVSCASNPVPKYDGVWLEPGGRRPS